MRRGGGMVDTLDSKSGVHYGHTGSNPVRGTKEKSSSISAGFFLYCQFTEMVLNGPQKLVRGVLNAFGVSVHGNYTFGMLFGN